MEDLPRDPSAESAALLTQMDQAQATFGGIGTALRALHAGMIADRGIPRHVANKIVADVAHEWAQGTFNKPEGLTLPGFGPGHG